MAYAAWHRNGPDKRIKLHRPVGVKQKEPEIVPVPIEEPEAKPEPEPEPEIWGTIGVCPVSVQVQCERFHIKPHNPFTHVSPSPCLISGTTSVIKPLYLLFCP